MKLVSKDGVTTLTPRENSVSESKEDIGNGVRALSTGEADSSGTEEEGRGLLEAAAERSRINAERFRQSPGVSILYYDFPDRRRTSENAARETKEMRGVTEYPTARVWKELTPVSRPVYVRTAIQHQQARELEQI